MSENIQNAIKYTVAALVAAAVATVTATMGFMGAYSDVVPPETVLERITVVLGLEILGAILIGLLLPRFWYLSFATAGSYVLTVLHGRIILVSAFFLTIALASGYLGAYVGRKFWNEEYISRKPRFLVLAVGIFLIGSPSWLLYETIGFPAPAYITRTDFLFCILQLLVINGGVLLGVLVYWARKGWSGQPLRPFGIITAGIIGVLALSPTFAMRNSIYTMTGHISPPYEWGLAITLWFFFGLYVATGAALLFYVLQSSAEPAVSNSLAPK